MNMILMNNRIVDEITEFIFIEDKLEHVDAIFIPGGSYPELAEEASKLWLKGYAPLVIPSGGVSLKTGRFNGVKARADIYNKEYLTECEFLTDVLMINGVDKAFIIGEDKASFTRENAMFSRKLLDECGIKIKNGIICCKNFHARRALMFYQFAFPESNFYIKSFTYYEKGAFISKDNWYKTEIGTKRVLGELERLGNQFNKDFDILRSN